MRFQFIYFDEKILKEYSYLPKGSVEEAILYAAQFTPMMI